MARNRFKIETVFQAIDKMTAPIVRIQNTVGRFSRKMTGGLRTLNRGVDKFTRGLKRSAIAITAVFAVSAAAMADVVTTGADFEKTLVSAGQRFKNPIEKGTAAFNELSDAARDVGRTTEFTASQGAKSIEFLARAGFDAQSTLKLLRPMIDFATASQLDLGLASSIATKAMGSFNLVTQDATQNQKNLVRTTDLMTLASNRANLTVEDMFNSLLKGAPLAVEAGQSIEDITAVITAMARSGIVGQEAGTALRNIMLGLTNPTSRAASILRRLKLRITETDGSTRSLVDVFEDFSTKLIGLQDVQRVKIFEEIFGRRPIAGAAGIKNATDILRELRDEMINTTGTTGKLAFAMRDTTAGSIFELKSAIESVKLSIALMEEGPMREAIDRTTAWIRKNEEFIASRIGQFMIDLINNFDQIVLTLKKVGIGLVAIFSLIAALKILIGVLTVLNLVLTANPIVLVVLAILAMIAALAVVIIFWDKFAVMIRNAPVWVKALVVAFAPFIAIPALILAHWEPIKEFFVELKDAIEEIGDAIVSFANAKLGKLLDIVDVVRNTGQFPFLGSLTNLTDLIAPLFTGGLGGDERASTTSGIVSASERESRSVIEQIHRDTIELRIHSDAGTVEVVGGNLGPRGLKITPTGAF